MIICLAVVVLNGCATQHAHDPTPRFMRLSNVTQIGDNKYRFAIRFDKKSVLLGHTDMGVVLGHQLVGYDPEKRIMTLKKDGKLIQLHEEEPIDPFKQ